MVGCMSDTSARPSTTIRPTGTDRRSAGRSHSPVPGDPTVVDTGSVRRRPGELTAALDREWRRARRRPSSIRSIRSWRTGDDEFDRWATSRLDRVDALDRVVALVDRRTGTDGDRLLHWLLVVAESEPLAARIVLQRLLPLAVSTATRLAPFDACRPPVDDVVTATVVAIAEYDRSVRRRHIAPRLIDRAIEEVFRTPRRRRSFTSEEVTNPMAFPPLHAPTPELDHLTAAARVLAAGAAAGIDPALLEVARRLVRGESTADIAVERRCTQRAVRQQRARVAERLRTALDESWNDWSDPLTGLEFASARLRHTVAS